MATTQEAIRKPLPFDAARLDKLLDEAGIDVLVATSKHNVQYLLGGYRFFFFDSMDAIGVSRYLPILVYRKGKPEEAAYVGCAMENFEKELGKFWPPALYLGDTGSQAAMQQAVAHIKKLARRAPGRHRDRVSSRRRRGHAAPRVCRTSISSMRWCRWSGCARARRREELDYLREASERVIASMQATLKQCKPGVDQGRDVRDPAARGGEPQPGVRLLPADGRHEPQPRAFRAAARGRRHPLARLGGNYKGYIGDLCRMGIVGKPDAELEDLLGFVEEVQQATRKPIRNGARGGDICASARRWSPTSPHATYTHYMAHGMGLVSHEAPRLMNIPRLSYTAYDADRPLETGMVISIETTMGHPKRGFVKLEDTVLVTADGWEAFGDGARGWNKAGE